MCPNQRNSFNLWLRQSGTSITSPLQVATLNAYAYTFTCKLALLFFYDKFDLEKKTKKLGFFFAEQKKKKRVSFVVKFG